MSRDMAQRDLWLPRFDLRELSMIGQDWPDVLIEKWEENGIGERRFVNARMARVNPNDVALERAANEGRNVLADATDDQAAVIEAWAARALAERAERRSHPVTLPDFGTQISTRSAPPPSGIKR